MTGLALKIYNTASLSSLLCVSLQSSGLIQAPMTHAFWKCVKSWMKTFVFAHNGTVVLSSPHPFFTSDAFFHSFYGSESCNDSWIHWIVTYRGVIWFTFTNAVAHKSCYFLLFESPMSLQRICPGWFMRQDQQWSIKGIKLLLACLDKQRSRQEAGRRVSGGIHTVYTTLFLFGTTVNFPMWQKVIVKAAVYFSSALLIFVCLTLVYLTSRCPSLSVSFS